MHSDRDATVMKRIIVVGTSGSGKTTLANTLAEKLGLERIELDALFWEENWSADRARFEKDLRQACAGERWVMDGNYTSWLHITWASADTIIWLKYDLSVFLPRLTSRTIKRIVTKEALWGGPNRETLQKALSRDSIILWALKTYRRQRRQFPRLFAEPDHAHLRVIELESPEACAQFLQQIKKPSR